MKLLEFNLFSTFALLIFSFTSAIAPYLSRAAARQLVARQSLPSSSPSSPRPSSPLPTPTSTPSANTNTANIPPSCSEYCSSVEAGIHNKCTSSLCCNDQFANNYYKCFQCVGSAASLTDWSAQQQTYNRYVQDCAVASITVPHFVFANPTSTTSPMPSQTDQPELDNNSATISDIHFSWTCAIVVTLTAWHLG